MLARHKAAREKSEQNPLKLVEYNAAQSRMMIDIKRCQQAQQKGIQLSLPQQKDVLLVIISITPNPSSFYHGARIEFKYSAPPNYPYASPDVQCLPSILHPNIDAKGNVCLSLLKEGWSSTYDLHYICIGLLNLLNNLNKEDIAKPLDLMAADLYHADANQYAKVVQQTLRGMMYKGRAFTKLIK